MPKLNHIVLIHGASHGGFCWDHLAPLLRDMGYRVSAPDLPGLGNDQTPMKDVTLQSYVDRAVETVKAAGERVLLVGHSMGGAVVSGAAEAVPEHIGKLVSLAGLLLADGDTMEAIMRKYIPQLPEPGPSGAMDFDLLHSDGMFYNTCTPEVAQWSMTRLRPQPFAPFKTAVRLTPARFGSVPKTYIVCTKDQALPPACQNWLCERAPGVKRLEMATDHSPFYSDPKNLAAILDAEARR
jgi:pimeloyl-ACP methyl ester carboxylesterase